MCWSIDRVTYRVNSSFSELPSAELAVVPEPASLIVWSLLGLSLVGVRRLTSRRR